jgi:hypothetical protein
VDPTYTPVTFNFYKPPIDMPIIAENTDECFEISPRQLKQQMKNVKNRLKDTLNRI